MGGGGGGYGWYLVVEIGRLMWVIVGRRMLWLVIMQRLMVSKVLVALLMLRIVVAGWIIVKGNTMPSAAQIRWSTSRISNRNFLDGWLLVGIKWRFLC